MSGAAHPCGECNKLEYDDAPHNHPKPSEGRIPSVEETEGTQLQDSISDAEFKVLNKPAEKPTDHAEAMKAVDKEISCLVSAHDSDITKLAAARLIIDHQADEIKQYQKLYATMKEQTEAKNEELEDWRNREAAICPEDVGFEEFIRAKDKEIARIQDERIDELRESAELRANIKAIADAVRPYTSHKDDCHFMHDPPDYPEGRCTCGLEQALKGGD